MTLARCHQGTEGRGEGLAEGGAAAPACLAMPSSSRSDAAAMTRADGCLDRASAGFCLPLDLLARLGSKSLPAASWVPTATVHGVPPTPGCARSSSCAVGSEWNCGAVPLFDHVRSFRWTGEGGEDGVFVKGIPKN